MDTDGQIIIRLGLLMHKTSQVLVYVYDTRSSPCWRTWLAAFMKYSM